jgi:subfamily B ATP-binding cassette protein MsbA
MASLRGELVCENVGFSYREGIPVLKDVSFVAPAGTTTALVGSSGSGKSTLISLVLTFNRPKTGRILIDGRDLATVRLRDYREHVGVVLQDNFLFDGTVRENISYSRPDATFEEIQKVSRIAHCDEFVEGFPEGYDTVVGERGVKVSGGQRQRIAIARAILANPRVLVLDEATSSLDSESEAMIQDGLRSLRSGRTTFVIAHRLSTITSADQILVIEKGEIVERGRHEELLARDGRYRELYDRQYKLEMDRFINPGEDFTPEPEVVSPAKRPTRRERL